MPDIPVRLTSGVLTYRRSPSGQTLLAQVDCTVLREPQADRVVRELEPLVRRFRGRIALRVSGVVNFSCAWINALVHLSRACAQQGGRLVIFGGHRAFTELIRNTGLDRNLRLASTQDNAMRLLGEPAPGLLDRAGRWLARAANPPHPAPA
jgi:anti-anti-sigma factor